MSFEVNVLIFVRERKREREREEEKEEQTFPTRNIGRSKSS